MIIHKTISIARPPDVAFKLFVEEIGQWWPQGTGHSFVGGDSRPTMESHVGGRFYERNSEGKEYTIGEVLAYEPGDRVAFTWHHGEDKGTSEVEVRFTAEGAGTRIDVEHSGWENVSASELAEGYNQGWDTVLGYFTDYAAK